MTSPSLSIKTYPSILLLEPIYIYTHGGEVTKGEVAPLALSPVYSVLLCNSVRKRTQESRRDTSHRLNRNFSANRGNPQTPASRHYVFYL